VVDRIRGRGREAAAARAEAEEQSRPAPAVRDPKAETWARVQLARNIRRPRILDLLPELADEFVELHGDRLFGDDEAVVTGFARIGDRRIVVIGQQKGADTEENIRRNFGMPHPEGYRKSMRIMELAERLGLPIVTFVDVPGAHPGPESEERGIAEAIARSIGLMSRLRTPIVVVITGEGGSGGALAIAACNTVLMLEHAIYTVASPEAAASILWRDSSRAQEAATGMKITAQDLIKFGLVDGMVPEPLGGAHRDPQATAASLKKALSEAYKQLKDKKPKELVEERLERLMAHGRFKETAER
jgi:acetyl-CoA carboxylase carboxyl transferase subunit alpha